MAIIVSGEERKISWFLIVGIFTIFIILIAATYFIFFSPTPLIETIVPPNLKKTSAISQIKIDTATIQGIKDSNVRNLLKSYADPIVFGSFGRSDPFLPY